MLVNSANSPSANSLNDATLKNVYEHRLLQHLENLVKFYPITEDQSSVLSALNYCEQVIQDTSGFKNIEILQNQGIYSLFASTQITKKPKLLLQGHVDVVKSPKGPAYRLDGDKIYGRGVWDMLFAVATYLTLFQEHADELAELDIGILLTGDEEIGGFYGSGWLVDQGYGGQAVLIPDSGEGFGDISVASKGAYNLDLIAQGRSHHGSRPWEGDGAANKLILMIHELMDSFDHSDKHNSTITVTSFESGGSINRGPSSAGAHLDIRFKDATDYKMIKQRINEICAHYGGEVTNVLHADNLKIDTSGGYFKDFMLMYEKHARRKITLSKAHGGSDARFYAKSGDEVIMIRPDGGCAHSDEEYVVKSSLFEFYSLMEEFILKTGKIK